MTNTESLQQENRPHRRKAALAGLFGLDLILPFACFYGLRLLGVDPWLALMLGAVGPALRIGLTVARARRVDRLALFTLSMLAVGTFVGLLSPDPRLLLIRESWLTALVGVWILASLLAAKPVLYEATLPLLPEDTAARWRTDWDRRPAFRRLLRWMTAGWGLAFLIDAAARVVMAYTLPVDVVPGASIGLLVLMLVIVIQAGKAYGRRHLDELTGDPATSAQSDVKT